MLPEPLREISATVKMIVSLLANKEYEELDRITQSKQCQAEQLMHWIVADRVELAAPPEEAFEDIAFFGETQ